MSWKFSPKIKRWLEDVALHLIILLVLASLASTSFLAASQLESRAESVSVSVTVTDPNAPPEEPPEPIIGSPPAEAPTNITVFTLTPEDDEFIMSDRGDGTAGLTKKFTLRIDPKDTTYPSQTQIQLTSNFTAGRFSLNQQTWSEELFVSIPHDLEFDFFYQLVLSTETVHRLTSGSSSTFQLKIEASETPIISRWLDLTFVTQVGTAAKIIPMPIPEEPVVKLPFFDETPSFFERILEPIRRIFEPTEPMLAGPTEIQPPTFKPKRDRYEIRIPLPGLPSTGGEPSERLPLREIVIPLSTYAYPSINLLLIVAIILGLLALKSITFFTLFPYRIVSRTVETINGWFTIDNAQGQHIENVKTDDRGRYTAYLTPGQYTMRPKGKNSRIFKFRVR